MISASVTGIAAAGAETDIMLLSAMDDVEAKFAAKRREFAGAEAAGKKAGETTEWVRSMERNLFDSGRWLGE